MTSPAEKADIGPESHALCPVNGRVRLFRMTDKTYCFAPHFFPISIVVEHIMRIDLFKFFKIMTFKTDRPTVGVRTAPQELWGPFMVRPAMYFMAGKTSDLAFVKRQLAIESP